MNKLLRSDILGLPSGLWDLGNRVNTAIGVENVQRQNNRLKSYIYKLNITTSKKIWYSYICRLNKLCSMMLFSSAHIFPIAGYVPSHYLHELTVTCLHARCNDANNSGILLYLPQKNTDQIYKILINIMIDNT